MVGTGVLASTAVMGATLLAVGAWLLRARAWQRTGPVERRREPSVGPPLPGERAVGRARVDQRAWVAAFGLLVVALAGGVILAVQGSVGAGPVVAGMIVLVAAYLVGGVYLLARSHGHVVARATGEALAATGGLLLVAMIVSLMFPGLS